MDITCSCNYERDRLEFRGVFWTIRFCLVLVKFTLDANRISASSHAETLYPILFYISIDNYKKMHSPISTRNLSASKEDEDIGKRAKT